MVQARKGLVNRKDNNHASSDPFVSPGFPMMFFRVVLYRTKMCQYWTSVKDSINKFESVRESNLSMFFVSG